MTDHRNIGKWFNNVGSIKDLCERKQNFKIRGTICVE